MNKRAFVILGVVLVVIASAFAFLIFNSSAKQTMQKSLNEPTSQKKVQEPSLVTNKPTDGQAENANSTPGKYVDYSAAALASAKGTKLIFFHASWCPQCRALEADINKKGVPNNVTVLKADYDTSQSLRQKYGVTIQTTVVRVDDNGNLIKKHVAYDEPTLDAVLKNLL